MSGYLSTSLSPSLNRFQCVVKNYPDSELVFRTSLPGGPVVRVGGLDLPVGWNPSLFVTRRLLRV